MTEDNERSGKQTALNVSPEFKKLLDQTYEENKDAMTLLKSLWQ